MRVVFAFLATLLVFSGCKEKQPAVQKKEKPAIKRIDTPKAQEEKKDAVEESTAEKKTKETTEQSEQKTGKKVYMKLAGFDVTDGEKAIIETTKGTIELAFFPEVAPNHVANFKKLANEKFYDGTIFHRVIPGFMIQGGDPNTKGDDKKTYGMGGPSHSVAAEFNPRPHVRGTLSMARSQAPNSAGSQFFICVDEANFLNNQYTVFGHVISGLDVVDQIVSAPRNGSDLPDERIEMKSVSIAPIS